MASDENYEIPESGAVFTFGRSDFADNQPSHFFIRNDPIVEISCGDEHTAVVCENGRVFLFGHNVYGQLGLGHTRTVNKPSCLKYLKPFHSTHIACGKGHTIVSTKCGRLFSFGSNSDGQLGVGDLGDKLIPQLINIKRFDEGSIKRVAAGCFHSACLTECGDLYTWGSNTDGQCGAEVDTNLLTPTKIDFNGPISDVSCGYYHTAFISEGNLYTFGEEDNGKLGYKKVKDSNVPRKVNLDFKCSQVKCGGNHTLILSEDGKTYGCGSNFSGQLGVNHNSAEGFAVIPMNFPKDVKVVSISAGESHSAFITENGELYTCGDGRYGKACFEDESTNLTSPTLVTLFTHFYCVLVNCGGCQTMVLARTKYHCNESDILISHNMVSQLPPLKVNKILSDNEPVTTEELLNVDIEIMEEIPEKDTEVSKGTTELQNYRTETVLQNENHVNVGNILHVADVNKQESVEENSVNRSSTETSIQPQVTVENEKQKNELEEDVVTGHEKKISSLFNIFKRKRPTIIKRDFASPNEKIGELSDEISDRKIGNQRKSRACSII